MKSFFKTVSVIIAFSITLSRTATFGDGINGGFETASASYTTGALGWSDNSGAPAGTTASAKRSTTDPFAGVAELTLAYSNSVSPSGGPAVIAQSDIFATSGGTENFSFEADGATFGFENNQVQVQWFGVGNSFLGATGFMSFQSTLTGSYSLQSESLTAPVGTTGALIQFLDAGSAAPNDAGITLIDNVSLSPASVPGPATWNTSGWLGDWNIGSNWSTGVAPNSAGAHAVFQNTTGSAQMAATNVPVTLGILDLTGSNSTTITGVQDVGLTMQTADGSTAQINVSGGTTHELLLPVTFASNAAVVVITGSTLEIGNPVTVNAGMLVSTSGAVEFDSWLYVATGGSLQVNGAITGLGDVVANGPGMLILSGDNTYAGGTFVKEGTLVVTNNEALLDGSSLTIGANASAIFGGAALPQTAVAVPEPSAPMLLSVAGIVTAAAVWRRKRN